MASVVSQVRNRLMRFLGYADQTITASSARAEDRFLVYEQNELLYANSIYNTSLNGGWLDVITAQDLRTTPAMVAKAGIFGAFNPVAEIVDAYQQCLPGSWGREMRVSPTVGGLDVNRKLIDADEVGAVWRASNLDTNKQKILEWAANLGTVGLRIVARNNNDAASRRVYVQADHPRRIHDFIMDDRGNVIEVMLKYRVRVGDLGTAWNGSGASMEVVERISADGFSVEYDGEEQLADEQRKNDLGVCPYVILRHRDRGNQWGDYAYAGSEPIIHQINWLIARQNRSVYEHTFPTWFLSSGGHEPKELALSSVRALFCRTEPGTPPPSVQAIVPNLDQRETREFWMKLIDLLRERQPELNINDVKLLAGVSGETMAQVLKPAEAAVLRARTNYDHAFVLAIQIAISDSIRLGLADIGSGTGTPEAAQSAYDNGLENFEFADRPALPQTVYDKLQQVALDTTRRDKDLAAANLAAPLVDRKEQLRIAGYTEKEIEQLLTRPPTTAAGAPAPTDPKTPADPVQEPRDNKR